jgi:ParB/RepB/Spo0J family partition protein
VMQKTIPLSDIVESATNPRKRFEDLDELAKSIKEKGVLQPVLVRPVVHGHGANIEYELVAGARRLRAAKLAGLTEIPALVREMSDAEVIECQVIENNQRKDVHPLEEAEGFAALAKQHGRTAEAIAAKLGRSVGYVYQRLKLTELAPALKKAFFDGKLTSATALVFARIPNAKLQEEAYTEATRYLYEDDLLPLSRAQSLVRSRYTLRIADAPFDTKDADLIPAVGACTTCPKNTGAQRELFADFGKDALCTDTVCFNGKKAADWDIKAGKARAKGLGIIDGKEAKKEFGGTWLRLDSEYVDLDAKAWDDKEEEQIAWRKRLGKHSLPITLARDPEGNVHELVKKADALALVKEKNPKDDGALAALAPAKKAPERPKADVEKEKQKQEIEDETSRRTVAAIVGGIEKKGITGKDAWSALLGALYDTIGYDAEDIIAERRGLKKEKNDNLLLRIAKAMNDKQVAALIVEMLVVTDSWKNETRAAFVELLGIDVAAIKKEAAAYVKAAKAETAKKGRAA